MYSGSLTRVAGGLEAVKHHLKSSEVFRAAIAEGRVRCLGVPPCFDDVEALIRSTPNPVEWRIIDHCSAVTRIYAIYEQFAEEMVREYVGFLERTFAFSELGEAFANNYTIGIGRILENRFSARYQTISLQNLIADYTRALEGKAYRLEPAAVVMREQNLRLQELHRLFANCGIDNVQAWIERHPVILAFFSDGERIAAGPESEMLRLIDYRNDAAHGALIVDEIASVDVLVEFADFAFLLCRVLAERVQKAVLSQAIKKDRATECGQIVRSLKNGRVVIAPVVGDFSVGQTIYLMTDRYCVERSVVSIQLQNAEQQAISIPQSTELGLGLNGVGKEGATIVALRPTTALGDGPGVNGTKIGNV